MKSEDIVLMLRRWAVNASAQDVQEAVDGLTQAADEIERLRAERDEARRIACKMEERAGCDDSGCPKNGEAEEIATRRGWDCFKEEAP